jgi:hypothetical protein
MRKRELEADNELLRRGADSLLLRVEEERARSLRYQEALENQRARLRYEIDVITSSLRILEDMAHGLEVALGVSRPGKTPSS